MESKIVIIEDDRTIRTVLAMALRQAGYQNIRGFERGDEGFDVVREWKPDLLLLDLMLPGMSGMEICRKVRKDETLAEIRIVMLTAKVEARDIVCGLEAGADDYVTKPFSMDVLLARVRAVLRRGGQVQKGRELDGLHFDTSGAIAMLDGEELPLTRAESKILYLFVSHPGRVYTRQQILDATQVEEKGVADRIIDVQMVSLRKKLGGWANHIETIRGIGYRVKP